jgi:hypothetical protein
MEFVVRKVAKFVLNAMSPNFELTSPSNALRKQMLDCYVRYCSMHPEALVTDTIDTVKDT